MRRILLTGLSGTGKSTLICELAQRGYKAVDTDSPEWCEWVPAAVGEDTVRPGFDWIWREDRIEALLDTEDADVLFASAAIHERILGLLITRRRAAVARSNSPG